MPAPEKDHDQSGVPVPDDFKAFAELFKQVINEAVAIDRELASGRGLAINDLMCMLFLAERQGSVSAKMVAEHVNLSTGATTALIDRLERDGYVERQPNPFDRRSVIIALVDEQAGPLLAEYEGLRHRLKRAHACLSSEEAKAVTRFFRKLLQED